MSKVWKKIYVVKKNLGKIFLKFFSWNLILIYILNYFYHFQPFSYYKKCAYLKEVIRRDSDQCAYVYQFLNFFQALWPTFIEFRKVWESFGEIGWFKNDLESWCPVFIKGLLIIFSKFQGPTSLVKIVLMYLENLNR